MKFTQLLAAGLAFATLSIGATAPAEAQRHDRGYNQGHRGNHYGNDRRDDRRYRHDRHDRRDDRRYRGRDDRRNGYSQRCRFETRGGQRIQRCR